MQEKQEKIEDFDVLRPSHADLFLSVTGGDSRLLVFYCENGNWRLYFEGEDYETDQTPANKNTFNVELILRKALIAYIKGILRQGMDIDVRLINRDSTPMSYHFDVDRKVIVDGNELWCSYPEWAENASRKQRKVWKRKKKQAMKNFESWTTILESTCFKVGESSTELHEKFCKVTSN